MQNAFENLYAAAVLGHSAAQGQAGLMYSTGTGVLQDQCEAYRWLARSANQGDKVG